MARVIAWHTGARGQLRDLFALAEDSPDGFHTLSVATAERDAFTPADGYPAGLTIDGIPLRDRVWLTLEL